MALPSIARLMQQQRDIQRDSKRAYQGMSARAKNQNNYDLMIYQQELAKAKKEASKGFALGELISAALNFIPVVGPALSSVSGFVLPYEMADDHLKDKAPQGKFKGEWNSQMNAIDSSYKKESIKAGMNNLKNQKWINEKITSELPWMKEGGVGGPGGWTERGTWGTEAYDPSKPSIWETWINKPVEETVTGSTGNIEGINLSEVFNQWGENIAEGISENIPRIRLDVKKPKLPNLSNLLDEYNPVDNDFFENLLRKIANR